MSLHKELSQNNSKTTFKTRLLSFLPALLLMLLIFRFSAKTAVQSSATSSPIAETLLKLYEAIFGAVNSQEELKLLDLLSYLVRKTAHILEYALLSFFYSFHFFCIKFKGKKLWLSAVAASTLYAATDEFHQLFVEGRSGELRDILIDTLGAVAGTFLFLLILSFFKKRIK